MHEYDIALKSLLVCGSKSLLDLTKVTVDHWLSVELPEVRNRRVDLLGETADRRIVHIELQSTHDATMALRMMEYSAAVFRKFGRFPEQVVLYVGERPLRMTGTLKGAHVSFECRIVDIRELDGERLLESPRLEDNVIAILAKVRDQRSAIRRILRSIASSDPDGRAKALAGFLILAGLRRLATGAINQEASQMPILDDIMDHPILGSRFKLAQEQGLALGLERGLEQGLERGLERGLEQGLERGLEQGLEQGLERGLERGRHDGELGILLRLMERRFGRVSTSVKNRLAKMSASEVEATALRLLDARSVEELLD